MSQGAVVAVEITEEDDHPKPASESDSKPPFSTSCLLFIEGVLILVLVCLVYIPIYLFCAGVGWLFYIDVTKCFSSDLDQTPDGVPGKMQFYERFQKVQDTTKKVAKLPNVIRSRIVIFVMVWVIVNFSVPGLRNKLVLGSKLWKWTLLVTMVSCGYHLISMITRFLVYLLCSTNPFKKNKNRAYFTKGLRRSVNWVLLSGLVLLTWVSYFRTSHGIKKNKDTDTVLHVCTWSFVSVSVTAVLWVLKTVLLLKWEADAVYGRFKDRILNAGFQVYFLGLIFGSNLDISKPNNKDEKDDKVGVVDDQTDRGSDDPGDSSSESSTDLMEEKNRIEDLKKDKGILFSKDPTLYDIKKMTKSFIDLSRVSSREDDGSSDVLKKCREINIDDDPDRDLTMDDLTYFYEKEDAQILYSKLKEVHKSREISYKNFEKYMVKAQKNCVALGHTLLDALEVVKVLNKVMTGVLVAIVFIAWLLLTDIATTKILVLIASPLLAVTFVFGDTCKKIFEGIIFSFINHPFNVGDRCIIDKTEVEVKRMSVLLTKFVVIGTNQEALYPNSALASVPIINLKGEPDPSDSIELTLGSDYTKSMLDELQNNINGVFEGDEGKKYEKTNTIVIKEIGNSVKMEIQYINVMSIHETTHSQCLEKKRKQKSELLLQIKQVIEEINDKFGTSTSPISEEFN